MCGCYRAGRPRLPTEPECGIVDAVLVEFSEPDSIEPTGRDERVSGVSGTPAKEFRHG